MNISIDLGNAWDILSALSATGAVFLSLWVLRRENKAKIDILIGTKIESHEENGMVLTNCDDIIQVSAFNSGKTTVGMSFIGFGVGVERQRILGKEDYEISTYVSTIDKIFDSPELEMIQPGQISKKHEISKKYLYETSKKYRDFNGDLLVLSVFKDLNGKSYFGKINIQKAVGE